MPGSRVNGLLKPNRCAISSSLLWPRVPASRPKVELQEAAKELISGGEPLHLASSPSALGSVWPDSGSLSSSAFAGESLVSPPSSIAAAELTILNEEPGANVSFAALFSIGLPVCFCSDRNALLALALSCVATRLVL